MELNTLISLKDRIDSTARFDDLASVLLELKRYIENMDYKYLNLTEHPEHLGNYGQLLHALSLCSFKVLNVEQEKAVLMIKDFDPLHKTELLCLECTKLILHKISDGIKAKALVPVLKLCFAHYEKFQWTNCSTIETAHVIIEDCCKLTKCKTVSELLLLKGENSTTLVDSMLHSMKPDLSKDAWKNSLCYPHLFKVIFLNIPFNHLVDIIPNTLPPILLFIDDYELDNQLIGICCMNYLLDNVPSIIMRQNGRAEVTYDALKRLAYVKESELVTPLFSCLIKLSFIIDNGPKKKTLQMCVHQDEIFSIFLLSAETERRNDLRLSYASLLNILVKQLGMNIVKHLKRTLNVIYEYLQISNSWDKKLITRVLEGLNSVITRTWPRIHLYSEEITKSLLRLLFEVSVNEISPEVSKEIKLKCFDCLSHLSLICPLKFQELCKSIPKEHLNLPYLEILKSVPNPDIKVLIK